MVCGKMERAEMMKRLESQVQPRERITFTDWAPVVASLGLLFATLCWGWLSQERLQAQDSIKAEKVIQQGSR